MWSKRRERVSAFANDGRKEEEEEGLCDQREEREGKEGRGGSARHICNGRRVRGKRSIRSRLQEH